MTDKNWERVELSITEVDCCEDMFGVVVNVEDLKTRRLALISLLHPDKQISTENKSLGEGLCMIVNSMFDDAMKKLEDGTYGTNKSSDDLTTIDVGGEEYVLLSVLLQDDFVVMYIARNSGGEAVIIKMILNTDNNDLIENEKSVYQQLDQHHALPGMLKSFRMPDGKLCLILKYSHNSYTFEELRSHFPDGLPQEHLCWIMSRTLSGLGFLHKSKIIHGSIEPCNLVVRPQDHNVSITNFMFSILDANEPGSKYSCINEFSAPEITKTTIPNPRTDIFSLGKCFRYLVEVDGTIDHLDQGIREIIEDMNNPHPHERAGDAWMMAAHLDEVRKQIYGTHQFIPLNIR